MAVEHGWWKNSIVGGLHRTGPLALVIDQRRETVAWYTPDLLKEAHFTDLKVRLLP